MIWTLASCIHTALQFRNKTRILKIVKLANITHLLSSLHGKLLDTVSERLNTIELIQIFRKEKAKCQMGNYLLKRQRQALISEFCTA